MQVIAVVDDDIIIRGEVFIHTDNNNHKPLDWSMSIKIFLSSDQERERPLDTERTTLNPESTGIWTLKLELGSPAAQLHDSNLIKF